MVILFNVCDAFLNHFLSDNFVDSLHRISSDVKSLNLHGLSGNYELELIEMLIHSFSDSYVVIPSDIVTNKSEV